ncbi:unnamed protein product, partial [Cladocopium goreaui]
ARCCQCSSGQVTWSVDGCKVCQDQVQKIALVSETCKEDSPNFKGRVACQSECNSKLQTSGIFLQEDAKGYVSKTASVSSECKKASPNFIGNSKCARACKSKVESSWSWQQLDAVEQLKFPRRFF